MKYKQIFDVVVVGNGALGLSLALTLIKRKLRVALVGESHRPFAASTAAGAMIACFGEVESKTFKSEYYGTKHKFAVRALRLWDDWLEELNEDVGDADIRVANGTVVILNSVGASKVDDVNFETIRKSLQDYNEPFEDVNPLDVEWLDPYQGSRPQRAIYLPKEHGVNPVKLLQNLEQSFIKHGGKLINEAGARIERNSDKVEALVLNSGSQITTKQIVLAAGVKTQELLDTLPDIAARIPRLVSGVGVSALGHTVDGTTPSNVIRTANRAFGCGLHVVPRQQSEVYVGATNTIIPKVVNDPKLSNMVHLLQSAYRQFRWNLSQARLSHFQVGNRPFTLDGFPLLGETDLKGLWIMTGTNRDGLAQSPYLAQQIAKLICGEKDNAELDMFKPVRQPIQPFTREEVIKETVDQIIATGYEDDWDMPVGWQNVIENNMYTFYEKFTEELHHEFTPPPEILVASSKNQGIVKTLYKYYSTSSNRKKKTLNQN